MRLELLYLIGLLMAAVIVGIVQHYADYHSDWQWDEGPLPYLAIIVWPLALVVTVIWSLTALPGWLLRRAEQRRLAAERAQAQVDRELRNAGVLP